MARAACWELLEVSKAALADMQELGAAFAQNCRGVQGRDGARTEQI